MLAIWVSIFTDASWIEMGAGRKTCACLSRYSMPNGCGVGLLSNQPTPNLIYKLNRGISLELALINQDNSQQRISWLSDR